MFALIAFALGSSAIELEVTCIAPAPQGSLVAFGRSDGEVDLVDVETGDTRGSFRAHGRVNRIAWAAGGSRLVTASFDGGKFTGSAEFCYGPTKWELWSPSRQDRLGVLETRSTDGARDLVLSPDSRRILLLGHGARIVDAVDFAHPMELVPRGKDWFECAAWTHDGSQVVLGTSLGAIAVFDGSTGKCVRWEDHEMGMVHCIALDPSGRTLVAGGYDHTLLVIDRAKWLRTATLHSKITWPADDEGFQSVLLDASGETAFLTTGDWGSVQAWSLRTNTCSWFVDLHGGTPASLCLAASPDGRQLACFGQLSAQSRLLDAKDGHTIADWSSWGITTGPQGIAWTVDGRFVLARAGRALVFDARSFELLYDLVPRKGGLLERKAASGR